MRIDVEPGDWTRLDPWWTAHVQRDAVAHDAASPPVFGTDRLAEWWPDLDSWWSSAPSTLYSTSSEVLDHGWLTEQWGELDQWWDAYAELGHETAVEIADVLEQSNEVWNAATGPFDTDPLAVDVTRGQRRRGPLQPSTEMDWSQWLAQLLQSSPSFLTEVFDVDADQPPTKIMRETRVPNEDGAFRRPDILVFNADHAISIEVKLGDENYGKTAVTARLVEQQYPDRKWLHTLLLPRRKRERLAAIVEPSLDHTDDDHRHLAWDDPGPIDVVYWKDVTAALRTVLRRGDIVDDHWAANAYLFCAVVEQRILNFHSQPVIDRLASPATVVDAFGPVGIAGTLGEQLSYLRTMVDT